MRQTLTREKLKALWPCDDKYLDMFDEHDSMNIEQAFDAGFTINNICWLMGVLDKREELVAFANFCAKQVEGDTDYADYAAKAADWATKTAKNTTASYYAESAAYYAESAARHAEFVIRKEQKHFLMELLK